MESPRHVVRFSLAAGAVGWALSASLSYANFNPDLVIATFNPDVGVYCTGDGAGGFSCEAVNGQNGAGNGAAAGDIDQNGWTDLVFANRLDQNQICYGPGNGGDEVFVDECLPVSADVFASSAVAVGHVDSDAFPDLVFANSLTQRDRLCRWAFMGLFDCTDISTDQLSSADVALGDVDGNGHLDAMFAVVTDGDESRVCLGNGLGGFTCNDIAGATRMTAGIAAADFNDDGLVDLALANLEAADQVCIGNGTGAFFCADVDTTERTSLDVAVGEFNGDGDPDLVFSTRNQPGDEPGPSRVCFGGAQASFSCEDLPTGETDAFGVAVYDWNRDGFDDFALANNGAPAKICLGAGNGTFSCDDLSGESLNGRAVSVVVPPPVHPAEDDVEVESLGQDSRKRSSAVATAADSRFVVVWKSYEDGEHAIRGRLYEATGTPVGEALDIETTTDGVRHRPDVAMAADGSFVVSWDRASDQTAYQVVARRFGANGTPFDDEFGVSTNTSGDQSGPRVAAAPDGSFLVAWNSSPVVVSPGLVSGLPVSDLDGSGNAVVGRVFEPDGSARTAEFVINQETLGSQARPSVAARSDGSFVATWDSEPHDGDSLGIFARIVLPDGSLPDDEFLVNVATTGAQRNADVAVGPGNRFVVTWQGPGDHDGSVGVRARVFASDGEPLSGEIAVNTREEGTQDEPHVAFGGGGRFVIAWREVNADSGDALGLSAQEFEPTGKKVGDPFSVLRSIDELGRVERPDVTAARDGRTIFVWTERLSSPSTLTRVFYRRFQTFYVDSTSTTTTSTTTSTTASTTTSTTVSTTTLTTTSTTTSTSVTTTTLPAVVCGDPIGEGAVWSESRRDAPRVVTASDALYILSAAVGSASCENCVCDVDGSSMVTAVDALAALQFAIGIDVELNCPPCPEL